MLDGADLAALALTSRLVDSEAKPLSPREFWQLSHRIEPSALRGKMAGEIASELAVPGEAGERIAVLFDRAAALAFAIEKLDHSGIWTIGALDQRYPQRLRVRLGDTAPVVLHGVGETSLLDIDGVGVVGSRNVSDEASQVARAIAQIAVKLGRPVVAGAARGVDRDAMNGAFEADGQVVGVLAESLERAVTRPVTRRGVGDGRICLVTQYAPAAPFSTGNAMGRNKIIYGLSRCTIVVATDHQIGGTWGGATEALKNSYGRVASWTGPGNGAGNGALVDQGAVELCDVTRVDELLREDVVPQPVKGDVLDDQLTLDIDIVRSPTGPER
jgi:predicted Rossmann fold nucleotide-binding protein DprA/Smf involved in DNA uptake